ncbi:MAG: GNAT family N-acetyltransferase [Candidatus Melainabacteria bacterium]|nr:GNAT family N-acetyltransferase [Candidatus Melainabacteria bacterium]
MNQQKHKLSGRIAELADIEPLEKLIQYAFRGGKSAKSWTGEEHLVRGPRITLKGLEEIISGQDQVVLIAEISESDQKKIVGCIHLKKENNHGHVGMLAVDPDLQSSGAGKFLMGWCESYAREHYSSTEMVGEVVSGRPELMDWYHRLGYKETGDTAPFNPDGVEHLVDGLFFVKISKPIN